MLRHGILETVLEIDRRDLACFPRHLGHPPAAQYLAVGESNGDAAEGHRGP